MKHFNEMRNEKLETQMYVWKSYLSLKFKSDYKIIENYKTIEFSEKCSTKYAKWEIKNLCQKWNIQKC